jgi:RNA polymerase-binding transcription factor DksA
MANFTEDQLTQLKAALEKRYLALKDEVNNELARARATRDPEQDAYSDSSADDLDTALIDRQINEMRELEMSMEYLNELEFGDCIDCGGEIGFERLLAQPSAQRCIECQSKYEKAFPQESNPSL